MTLMEISRRHAGSRQPSWGRMNMKETSAVILRAARPPTTAFSFGMSIHSRIGPEKTRPLHFSATLSRSSDSIPQKKGTCQKPIPGKVRELRRSNLSRTSDRRPFVRESGRLEPGAILPRPGPAVQRCRRMSASEGLLCENLSGETPNEEPWTAEAKRLRGKANFPCTFLTVAHLPKRHVPLV